MYEVELVADQEIKSLKDLAIKAESQGFKATWITDHYNNRNPFITLSSIATETDEIELGPGVTNPYYAHPAWIASAAASLNELADGRARLGIGAGDVNTLKNLCIERESPLNMIRESVSLFRALFRGETIDIDGLVQNASLNYDSGDIPVYIGAQGPRMLELAAEIGDGVLINASHPRDIKWSLERTGETDASILAYTSFSIHSNREKARKAAREPVSFIASGAPSKVLDRHGIDKDLTGKIGEAIEEGRFRDAFSLVSEKMLDAFSVSGDPGECVERVRELEDAGVDTVVVGSPIGPDPGDALGLAADSLMD